MHQRFRPLGPSDMESMSRPSTRPSHPVAVSKSRSRTNPLRRQVYGPSTVPWLVEKCQAQRNETRGRHSKMVSFMRVRLLVPLGAVFPHSMRSPFHPPEALLDGRWTGVWNALPAQRPWPFAPRCWPQSCRPTSARAEHVSPVCGQTGRGKCGVVGTWDPPKGWKNDPKGWKETSAHHCLIFLTGYCLRAAVTYVSFPVSTWKNHPPYLCLGGNMFHVIKGLWL